MPVHIPDNEGKACDAVVRILEKRTGATRANLYRPEDETDCDGTRVELCLALGTTVYAIEHTRIEAFKNQIKRGISFALLVQPVIEELDGQIPGPALYDLILPLDRHLKVNKRQLLSIQETLICWIREKAETLHETILDKASPHSAQRDLNDYIEDTPPCFPFSVTLRCQVLQPVSGTKPGRIRASRIAPKSDELERYRAEALLESLNDKCPKLHNFRRENEQNSNEFRTVLVLESDDIALTNDFVVAEKIPGLLADRLDAPDEIYLIATEIDTWWVRPIKRGTEYWLRDGSAGWDPVQFPKDELDDLKPL